jgi:ribA/ribD-fused uncharacterized protein
MNVIDSFTGEYRWLSNFWPATIFYDDLVWPSSEHLYQAAKSANLNQREMVRLAATPGIAKRLGKKLDIREDWNDVKLSVMAHIIKLKFDQNPDLQRRLKDTGDTWLIEGNTWNDTFWGVCNGRGENHLGNLIMRYRASLG